MPKISEGISHLIPAEMQMNAVLVLGDTYRPSVLKGKSATLLGLKFAPHRLESEMELPERLDRQCLARPAPPPVPAGDDRVYCVARGRLVDVVREGIAHRDAAEHGAVLKILGQQDRAALKLRRGDDHAVPPIQPPALLDIPRSFE